VYVLDTSVASGLLRQGDPAATGWMSTQRVGDLYLAAPVVYEIVRGFLRLPAGPKRDRLELAWRGQTLPMFERRVLSLDAAAATTWARLMAEGEGRGRKPPLLDCQIAAIAIENRMTVVTLDRRGFGELGCGLLVLA
jgi:predicted nucleic acid-binding protein